MSTTAPPPLATRDPTDWLALAVQTAHVAVGVSRLPEGVFVEVNDAFCRLYGRTRSEILGRTAAELDLWADLRQRDRLLELVRRHGGVTGFEARYRHRAGETGHLQVSARIVMRDGVQHLVGFLSEVTDRHEMLEGLRAAQARLGVVLRSSGMLVFRQDAQLRYTWVANPVLGVTEADVLGRTDEDLLGADAAAPLVAIKQRVLRTGRAERRDVWVENQGQRACFDLVVEPELDAAGRVGGILCAAHDITGRMAAAAPAGPGARQAILGMAALIGCEPLTPGQALRLARIEARAGHRPGTPGRPDPDAEAALAVLRRDHRGARVLVCEGNPVLREMVAALLADAGLAVTEADHGVTAFSLALEGHHELVLLDMELPQRGGVAAARAIRTMLPWRVPLIAMMSGEPPMPASQLLDADLDDVMGKPQPAGPLYVKVLAWLQAG